MAEQYTGLPLGKKVVELAVVTKVAEAAIPILASQEYVPVIAGTADYQVLAATDSATTVLGFAKRPTSLALSATSIPISTEVTVVTLGVVKVPVNGALAVGNYVEVHSTTTQVAALTIDTYDDYTKAVGKSLTKLGASGDAYIRLGL